MNTWAVIDAVWIALFAAVLACLAVAHIRAAITGRFPTWRRKPDGRMWPPLRSRTPVRFWLVWAALAIPVLYLSALLIAGLLIMAFGR